MSSIGSTIFNTKLVIAGLMLAMFCGAPALANSNTEDDSRVVIDILAPAPTGEIDPRLVEECERQEDAAQISQEIVVCRELRDRDKDRYNTDREEAERRYAERTAFRDAPATPDPCGPMCGIFKGPPSVGNLCLPGLQKCPPPPALIIDLTALPKAPPGSDADRIARGLPPIGRDHGTDEPEATDQAELGLPKLPANDPAAPSPAELAVPKVEQ